MRRFTGTLENSAGQPQPGAQVQVFVSGTNSLASLFNASGTGIGNPITTDQNGQYSFNVLSGVYDIADASGNLLLQQVQIFDFTNPAEWLGVWRFPASGFSVGTAIISADASGNIAITGGLTVVGNARVVNSLGAVGFEAVDGSQISPAGAFRVQSNSDAMAFQRGTAVGPDPFATFNTPISMLGSAPDSALVVDSTVFINAPLQVNATLIGFFGAVPIGVQNVSGSRGGNAALLSLVQALAALGLINNLTS